MSDDIQKLRQEHQKAQTARRELEQEQRELPGKVEYALSGGDVTELQRLNKRKREVPDELQLASQVEHSAYGSYVKAEQQNEDRQRREAKAEYEAAAAQLQKRRDEWAIEQNALVAAADKAQRKIDAHQREIESWATRFSIADTRFRQAVNEQEAA